MRPTGQTIAMGLPKVRRSGMELPAPKPREMPKKTGREIAGNSENRHRLATRQGIN